MLAQSERLPPGHVSYHIAQIPLPKRTSILHKQTTYEQDALCGRCPRGPLFGQYALEKKERTAQIGVPLDCSTTAVAALSFQAHGELPCLLNRPLGPPMPQSLRGVPCHYTTMHYSNPNSGPGHTPQTGHFFNFNRFFSNHDIRPPPPPLG